MPCVCGWGDCQGEGGWKGEGVLSKTAIVMGKCEKSIKCCSARMESGAVPSRAQESGGGGGWIVYRLAAAQVRLLVPHGTDRPKRSRT